MTFKLFSSFHHHVFKRSYGQKTTKNPIFGQLSFFSKNHISKTVHLTEKEKIRSIGKILQTCDFCHPKSSTKTKRCFSEAVFFSLKKGLFPQTGTKRKKYISNFVQNFILIMIKIEPKLAGKVLVGNPYFPVY